MVYPNPHGPSIANFRSKVNYAQSRVIPCLPALGQPMRAAFNRGIIYHRYGDQHCNISSSHITAAMQETYSVALEYSFRCPSHVEKLQK